MKTITLNFEKWSDGSNGRRPIRRTYNRIYFLGYIWTPFVIVTWKYYGKDESMKDCPSTLEECTPFKDEKGEGYEFTFQLEYEEELK